MAKNYMWLPLALVLVLPLLACEEQDEYLDGDEQGDPDVASVEQGVQYEYASGDFSYDTSTFYTLRTGALFCNKKDADGDLVMSGSSAVRGTCGVTFVSPHYAITAAHCVNGDDCGAVGEHFTVQQYDISGLDMGAAADAREILTTGSNAWPYWQSAHKITSAEGYVVHSYNDCEVKVRCDTSFGGKVNPGWCKFGSLGASFTADIALIYCPSRTLTGYMPVATADEAVNTAVHTRWAHEVVEGMPLSEPGIALLDTWARWNHYTSYSPPSSDPDHTAMANNYHYQGPKLLFGFKQLLPLRSEPWSSTQQRKITSVPTSTTYAWTDLYGCHGTSGAGVLKTQGLVTSLLGPMAVANGLSDRLCIHTSSSSYYQGANVLGFTRVKYTKALADYAYINDGVSGGAKFYTWLIIS